MTVFESKYVYGLVEVQSSITLTPAIPSIADTSFWKLIYYYCNFQVRHRVINLWTKL